VSWINVKITLYYKIYITAKKEIAIASLSYNEILSFVLIFFVHAFKKIKAQAYATDENVYFKQNMFI